MASYFSDHNVDEPAGLDQAHVNRRMMSAVELQLQIPGNNVPFLPAEDDMDELDRQEADRLIARFTEDLPPERVRNPADAETLMDRLMAMQLVNAGNIEPQGTSNPPASEKCVAKLPKVQFDQVKDKHSTKACPICTDDFTADCDISRLPCMHHYHRSCIVPWLNKTNNCPLCRYELPTDDAAYEQRKKDRQAREIAQEMYNGMYN